MVDMPSNQTKPKILLSTLGHCVVPVSVHISFYANNFGKGMNPSILPTPTYTPAM